MKSGELQALLLLAICYIFAWTCLTFNIVRLVISPGDTLVVTRLQLIFKSLNVSFNEVASVVLLILFLILFASSSQDDFKKL